VDNEKLDGPVKVLSGGDGVTTQYNRKQRRALAKVARGLVTQRKQSLTRFMSRVSRVMTVQESK